MNRLWLRSTSVRASLSIVVAAAAAACVTPLAAAAQRASAPPFRYAWILKASRRMGTDMPSSAIWVASRRRRAVRTTGGDSVNSDQPVYVVEMAGHFTARDVSVPAGAKVPTGPIVTYVVDRRTGKVWDFGISNHRSNLHELGRVHNLLPWLRRLG